MNQLFEYGDIINNPMECFYFDSEHNSFPVHAHWHYYMEIIYMLEGVADITADAESYRLFPGDMILFHPQAVHAIDAEVPVRYAVLKFDVNIMNSFPNSALKFRYIFRHAKANDMTVFFPADIFPAGLISSLFEKCIYEMHHQSYGSNQLIQTKINELLIEIIRFWIREGFFMENASFHEEDYTIYTITEFIDKHLDSGLTVPDVAKACNMSYSYFAKKFPTVYGKTCKEYMEELRLYKVEEYLLFTNFDLNYIAQETGFSDCSHMIKSFKKRHSLTPKQYRDTRRGHH